MAKIALAIYDFKGSYSGQRGPLRAVEEQRQHGWVLSVMTELQNQSGLEATPQNFRIHETRTT
jgi:hypothetical protein